jgi:hypothetical protein
LHTLYKPNGINDVISLKVGGVSLDQKALDTFSGFVLRNKLQSDGGIDLTNQKTVADSMKAMLIAQFLSFLEQNKMIRYDVKTDGSMDADDIDPKLLDELYAGTPLENLK